MKLKAPEGVGDPCVAGVPIMPRDGFYEVDPAIGALLIECFGFAEVETAVLPTPKPVTTARRSKRAARKT